MSVTSHRDGDVGRVTIDRPQRRNAVDGPTAALLAAAMRGVDADPAVRVVVLTRAGGMFCRHGTAVTSG